MRFMKGLKMRHLLLTVAVLAVPSLAMASPDCGDEVVQTAEAVLTIQTPEQFAAPIVAAPVVDATTVAPTQTIAPVIAALGDAGLLGSRR